MKEYLKTLIQSSSSPVQAHNLTREYLQALILQSLQRTGAMATIAFHGGTALRFLYSLPRYSEDLDFALERDSRLYDFRSYLQAIRKDLEAQGYEITLKVNDQKTVHSAFIRFSGLLYELKLSPHQNETLAVKLEVDTNPPPGAVLDTSLIRHHVLLNLQHHDRASLLAGKLHAILQRPYLKGRDLYDLIWYLSDKDWPVPNLVLLNNALKQTKWEGPAITLENWRESVRSQVKTTVFEQALDDVRPFLASAEELGLITKDNFLRLLTAS
jgi:predicted nucleotidyltransferase component of viral defense system